MLLNLRDPSRSLRQHQIVHEPAPRRGDLIAAGLPGVDLSGAPAFSVADPTFRRCDKVRCSDGTARLRQHSLKEQVQIGGRVPDFVHFSWHRGLERFWNRMSWVAAEATGGSSGDG